MTSLHGNISHQVGHWNALKSIANVFSIVDLWYKSKNIWLWNKMTGFHDVGGDQGSHSAYGLVWSQAPPTSWDLVILVHNHVFLLLYHRCIMENTFAMNFGAFQLSTQWEICPCTDIPDTWFCLFALLLCAHFCDVEKCAPLQSPLKSVRDWQLYPMTEYPMGLALSVV